MALHVPTGSPSWLAWLLFLARIDASMRQFLRLFSSPIHGRDSAPCPAFEVSHVGWRALVKSLAKALDRQVPT